MVMAVLLLIGAFVVALVGAMLLTQATIGVGFIALACFAGIVARVIQAQILSGKPV